jgi:hypothetical protein
MADRYNKIKTWTKNYLFFQDLNTEVDGVFTALNDLDVRKANIANGLITANLKGNVEGNVTGNVTGDLKSGSTIDGQALLNVFEEDTTSPGKILPKAKEASKADVAALAETATIAEAAKGDKRFQISGCVGGASNVAVGPGNTKVIQTFYKLVPAGERLIIKEVSSFLSQDGGGILYGRLRIIVSGGNEWVFEAGGGVEYPEFAVTNVNSSDNIVPFSIGLTNVGSASIDLNPRCSWWFDLSIE